MLGEDADRRPKAIAKDTRHRRPEVQDEDGYGADPRDVRLGLSEVRLVVFLEDAKGVEEPDCAEKGQRGPKDCDPGAEAEDTSKFVVSVSLLSCFWIM